MIAVELLLASALGELPEDADLVVEEHVLSCGRCAARYASFLRLGPEIGALIRGGGAGMPVTRSLVDRLDAEGLISRRYELRPDEPVPCTVGPDDVYSLTTYHVDPAGAQRIDVVREGERLTDVPFDAAAGRLYVLTRSSALRTLPTGKVPLRLIAVDDAGERTLGEYVLHHTAPGG